MKELTLQDDIIYLTEKYQYLQMVAKLKGIDVGG